ncbi:CpsD/CapB family tyrosine-protein kinase [Cohnella fermenti]|uniref:CpsD/CapB family tyrosine-protein kinase n=1 Tax=Cohnella fermenti TaxID=2565925 RepID=A0A4S4BMK9_9BACL|nr:CpsD/CapB family tyrosine-protein kinase [Cohnella fermenti]THF73656.1 CpsD/CapB family tyrosine-protein kinase [Cohnella fermenti]
MSHWMRNEGMRSRGLITSRSPKSKAAEGYRKLRTSIEMLGRSGSLKTIAVVSAESGEGRSTTSANIAVAYSQANRKVLLLDSDLRSPALHRIFELRNDKGLSTVLAGDGDVEVAEVAQRTEIDNLRVVCAGPVPPNPAELLESEAMTALLESAKRSFDIVILDTAAMQGASDGLIVADKCDGAVLVIRRGRTKLEAAERAKESLEASRTQMIGAVFNRIGR